MVYRAFVIMLVLSVMSVAYAEDKKPAKKAAVADEAKELSGISIIGNKEAPKSLYIVPWKDSEVGVENSLTSGLLDERMKPVDKEVFERELEFYQLTQGQ
jgi:hypothetical protein